MSGMKEFIVFCIALFLAAGSHAATVVDDRALSDEADSKNWLAYGKTYSEKRFSTLDEIDLHSVKQLSLKWYLDLPKDNTLTSTPLAVDGTLFFTGSYSRVKAVDAKTGSVLWEYDPKVVEVAGKRLKNMWDTSRGLAFWKNRLLVATIDGRLLALDAKTGQLLWENVTTDVNRALYITGVPKVFGGRVIIGNGGTEHTAVRGYVTAYDIETGDQLWRWFVVPGNPADGFENSAMEMAAKTWTGDWWKFGGGGTVWNGITYDPEFDQIIMGTGNGTPWNRRIRSPGGGDNLFLCSIVALDASTGSYKWHYQTVPGEAWDYNSNMDIILADLKLSDSSRKVLLHAPKNGFFYVIDRKDGKLISAEKIGKVTWASHIDLETGRPVENPEARYEGKGALVWPSTFGVHNWQAMSFNPITGLAYIPTIEMPAYFSDEGIDLKAWRTKEFRMRFGVNFEGDTPKDWGSAALLAWDPVKQEKAWSVENPPSWNSGTLTTAGNLVFQGHADGNFVAYDATNGDRVWSINLGLGISAPAVTYEVEGTQHVSVLVGWGGGGLLFGSHAAQHGWPYRAHPRRLFTFILNGKGQLPKFRPPVLVEPLDAPELEVDEELAAAGSKVYTESCLWCHGTGAVSGGSAPDLRASRLSLGYDAFRTVVLEGNIPLGMPSFEDHSENEVRALYHYVRREARVIKE